MQKISDSTNTANPAGEFTEGNPAAGAPATLLKAQWLNAIQRELVALVLGAGITLNASDDAQVLKAVKALAGAAADFDKLTNKPTTLSGYKITDGATKTELTNGLASKQAALGFAPVQQGTGVGQSTNLVKIGWSNNSSPQLKVTVGESDQGYFWLSSNFNPATKADVATTPTKTDLSNGLAAKPNADDVSYVGFASGDARQPYFRKKANDAVYLLQPALGYTPVQQGTGIGQSANPIKIGHSPNGPKITVDNTDFGVLWCQNNFSPDGKADKSNTYTIEQVEAGLANRPVRDSITAVGLASNDPNQPYMRRASDNSLVMLSTAANAFGNQQTPQNVTSSRAIGTVYTNNTGRPIFVSVYPASSQSGTISLAVGGEVVSSITYNNQQAGAVYTVCYPVGPGVSYSVSISGSTIGKWTELR